MVACLFLFRNFQLDMSKIQGLTFQTFKMIAFEFKYECEHEY